MTRRPAHLAFALGLAAGLCTTLRAVAQPGDGFAPLPTIMVDDVFAPITVREAISRGKAEGRLTVVVTALARPPRGREAWWANASLRAWLQREAIVVWAQPRNADLLVWVASADRGLLHSFAGIDLFIDGTHVPGAGGSADYDRSSALSSDFSPALADVAPVQLDGKPAPTAEWVLTTLDAQRELAAVRSPVFAHRARERRAAGASPVPQTKATPEPAPPRQPVYGRETSGIPAIMDLQREPAAPWRAVTQRAAEAASAAAAGKAGNALAAWTWLWERAAKVDPAAAFIGELAMVALVETSEQTELARGRLVALIESNPGDSELIASRTAQPFGAPGDAALQLLLATAGSPAAVEFSSMLGADDLATWRVTSRRAIASPALAELRKLISPDQRRAAMSLNENAAVAMLADLRDARRPQIVDEQEWEGLQSVRRAQIISLHARAAYLCTRAGGKLDIDAGHAARRLIDASRSWPSVDRAAAARAIGLAFILAERRPPAFLDDLQFALDQAGSLDPSRPTQVLIDAVVALPDARDDRK